MQRLEHTIAIALVVATSIASANAIAVSRSRMPVSNPVGACQGALPSYEGALRKRPLSIFNEGATPAFISCNLPGEAQSTGEPGSLFVFFVNHGPTSATVSCTRVFGIELSNGVRVTKSLVLPGNSGNGSGLEFEPQPDPFNDYFSLSCVLPPNVGIINMFHGFQVDVGA